jgi:hypothetical protein
LHISDQTAGASRWHWDTSGHYLPSTDNTYDAGSGANRIRALYSVAATVTTLTATTATLGTLAAATLAGGGAFESNGSGYPVMRGKTVVLAAGGTAVIAGVGTSGMVVISRGADNSAVFLYHTGAVSLVSQIVAEFGVAAGSASHNLYRAGGAALTLQNNTGAPVTYRVHTINDHS